jgi:hypothetical protein
MVTYILRIEKAALAVVGKWLVVVQLWFRRHHRSSSLAVRITAQGLRGPVAILGERWVRNPVCATWLTFVAGSGFNPAVLMTVWWLCRSRRAGRVCTWIGLPVENDHQTRARRSRALRALRDIGALSSARRPPVALYLCRQGRGARHQTEQAQQGRTATKQVGARHRWFPYIESWSAYEPFRRPHRA